MSLNSLLTTTLRSGRPYFRITPLSLLAADPREHAKVVNGQGAKKSNTGARHNYPGVESVYLTEELETCFAEKMFYFHREVLKGIDISHHTGVIPPFEQEFVLWEVSFDQEVPDILDLCLPAATGFFNVFPSMLTNPSQDYEHLKQRRADIESSGYLGLKARSSRAEKAGSMVVLFNDQSGNVQSITPYRVKFRLITEGGSPFINHAGEIIDFNTGEVKITSSKMPTGAAGRNYQYWQRLSFNH